MSNIVPFNFAAPAVNLAKKRETSANAIFLTGNAPNYPELSIKGKVFTLVKGDTRKVLMRTLTADDGTVEQIAVTSIPLVIVAANTKARVYFEKGFSEDADIQKPLCFSFDGQRPDGMSNTPQAKSCQVCPHAKWGSKVRTDSGEAKGTACTPRTRMAVTDPNKPAAPFMLNVPPGSLQNLRGAIGLIEAHGKDFFEAALRVKFDMEAATPKLVFEPFGMLTDEALVKVKELQADPIVAEILGVPTPADDAAPATETPKAEVKPDPKAETKPPAKAVVKAPPVTDDEIDGVLGGTGLDDTAVQAKAVVEKAKADTKPKVAPKAAAKAEPKAAPASIGDELLDGLAGLLGSTDD